MEVAQQSPQAVAIAVVAVAIVAVLVSRRRSRPHLPPCESGWLPYIGVAVAFGKEPLHYIRRCKEKFGDIFTIYVAGKRMTFLFDPEDFDTFFNREPIVSFQAAVQPFTKNAAGITVDSFANCHKDIHDMMKGRLAPSNLGKYVPKLSSEFAKHIAELESRAGTETSLLHVVRKVIFHSAVTCLFGSDVMRRGDDLFSKFYVYDKDFEYGCQLPEIALREWASAKHWLIDAFTPVVRAINPTANKAAKSESNPPTDGCTDQRDVLESLVEISDAGNAPNYALLLLWASQANSIPASFWTLANMASTPGVWARAREEAASAIGKLVESGEAIGEEHIKKMPFIKRCILETVRLRSPGMIPRLCTEPQYVKGYLIPKGDLLMLSPFWVHRNAAKFDSPDEFMPDRWLNAELDKNKFLDGFIGFGGGRFQCPGRWFALMEMQLFIAMFVLKFSLELLGPVPPPSPLHLVGVQEPSEHLRARILKA